MLTTVILHPSITLLRLLGPRSPWSGARVLDPRRFAHLLRLPCSLRGSAAARFGGPRPAPSFLDPAGAGGELAGAIEPPAAGDLTKDAAVGSIGVVCTVATTPLCNVFWSSGAGAPSGVLATPVGEYDLTDRVSTSVIALRCNSQRLSHVSLGASIP